VNFDTEVIRFFYILEYFLLVNIPTMYVTGNFALKGSQVNITLQMQSMVPET
jgi:hypothetical protein